MTLCAAAEPLPDALRLENWKRRHRHPSVPAYSVKTRRPRSQTGRFDADQLAGRLRAGIQPCMSAGLHRCGRRGGGAGAAKRARASPMRPSARRLFAAPRSRGRNPRGPHEVRRRPRNPVPPNTVAIRSAIAPDPIAMLMRSRLLARRPVLQQDGSRAAHFSGGRPQPANDW
jgi:hypothetical protein